MSKETLDPKHQRLMAALYGELSEEEEAAFHQSLLADPELREEWKELQETRSLLGEGSVEEEVPRFVFVDQEPAPARNRAGFWSGLRQGMSPPAWGFAGAAAILAVLLVSGLRMDRVDGGLVFRFGTDPDSRTLTYAETDRPGLLDVNPGQLSQPPLATPASQGMGSQTLSPDVVHMVSALLKDYEKKRNNELAFILNGMYEELRNERQQELDDIKTRVEVVGLGLMAEQNRTNAQIRTLIDRGPLNGEIPSPLNQNEDN